MIKRLMNIFGYEKRRTMNTDDPRLWEMFPYHKSYSGKHVDANSAMTVSAVYSCVKVLSETLASLPLHLYRRTEEGRTLATEHNIYGLLHSSPNDSQTSFEFREMLAGHVLLRGNAYAFKEFDDTGRLKALWPLHPGQVHPEVDQKNPRIIKYRYGDVVYPSELIWHLKDLTMDDGVEGLSRISAARQSIGLSMSLDEFGGTFFQNGVRPSGVLETAQTLKESAMKNLKDSFKEAYGGSGNAGKTLVLEQGLSWKQVGMSSIDAQFLESRNFQVEDIARIFRVPSMLIGHPDKTMTYASSEQMMLSFVMHTIRPWTVRLEQSISKSLLGPRERNRYYAEFNLEGLLRGDVTSRYEAYEKGIKNGWLSANDVRVKENMNRIPGGDIYGNASS